MEIIFFLQYDDPNATIASIIAEVKKFVSIMIRPKYSQLRIVMAKLQDTCQTFNLTD